VSNTYRIAQQEYITRRFYREPLITGGDDDADEDDEPKGGKPKTPPAKPADKVRGGKAPVDKPEPTKKPMPTKRPQPKANGATTPPKGRPTGSSGNSTGGSSGKGSSRPLPSKPNRPSPRRGQSES
jgi:hypothetical protein